MDDDAMTIGVFLCSECAHKECPGMIVARHAGGLSCSNYRTDVDRMAKATDAEVAALPSRDPCAGCVSRAGTYARATHHTLEDYRAAVEHGGIFICAHEKSCGRVCGGWLSARKARLASPASIGVMPDRVQLLHGEGE